jgi:hypothetical protein
MTAQKGDTMHWQIQPLIWVLVIGTLAILAIPRAAHPQPADLIAACMVDALRWCPAESASRDKARIDACMRAHRPRLSKRCRDVAAKHGL